jgi:hypothetical protein
VRAAAGPAHRLANGFAWAANYTGSVTKVYTAYDWYRTAEDNERRNSHKNGSRPHNAKITYNVMIPGASQFLGNNVIAKGVLDGWQLSGITTLLGGPGRTSRARELRLRSSASQAPRVLTR